MHFGGKSRALPPTPHAQAPAQPLGSFETVALHRNRTAFNLSCGSRRCVLQQSPVVQQLIVVVVCSSHSCSPAHICPHDLLLQANTIRPTRCKPQRECPRSQIVLLLLQSGLGGLLTDLAAVAFTFPPQVSGLRLLPRPQQLSIPIGAGKPVHHA